MMRKLVIINSYSTYILPYFFNGFLHAKVCCISDGNLIAPNVMSPTQILPKEKIEKLFFFVHVITLISPP